MKPTGPSVKCPDCGAEAAKMGREFCPKCKKMSIIIRTRLTIESQQAVAETKIQPILPRDIQYWVKQSDGSYKWSDWMLKGSDMAQQVWRDLQCPECSTSPRDQFTSGAKE